MQGAHEHTWVAVAPSKSGAGHVMSIGSSRLSPAAGCADMPQIERRAAEAARRGALTLRGSMLATPTWPIYKAVEAYLAAARALVRFLSANASTPCPVSVGQPSQVGGRARPSLLGPARAEGWVQSPDLQKLSNCPLMTAAAVDSAGAKLSTHDHERLHTGSAGAHPIENFLRALRARTTATTIPTTTSASISAFAFGVCVMFSLSHTHTHTLGAESTEGRTRGNSA